ncbi:Putative MetA-pathway of phenol degradation [Tenacibaculum sp. MAR_2009_124]|uniref:transporter n=1 Tax=Tenacibaculum sp. MAR_2009_124 TaxID=1250059 RepID=UPI00089C861E|nr:transporter [Tenacibaculum sp. MAR_2009_124]SEC89773.1 Putative MetA-pathway of phenol degradation [Tenacibaculum sp. MAR_2009_124]
MIKRLLFLFTFCSSILVQAQYTSVINSNRPGLSESPYSVGSGVYQLESTFFYRKVPFIETFSNPESFGANLLFRTSFLFEKLEFNLNTTLSSDKIGFKNVFESSFNTTGFSRFTLGAKYLVYAPKYEDKSKEIRSWKARHSFDWKRWIPHVGVYAGVNFGSILSDYHAKGGGISPKVGVLLQNEFSDKLNVISNLYYDNIGSDFPEYSYVITGTYNFNDYWSGFAELQGVFEKHQNKSSIGGGAAYLFNENLQFNASLRGNFEGNEFGVTSAIGVSYRMDRHEDKFVELDEFGNKIEEDKPIKYDENKGFFGRLFSKAKKLFKKKPGKREQKVDLDISPDKDEKEVRTEKPRRRRQESLIEVISKEDEKQKKKTTKEEKKAAKKAQKQTEKDAKKAQKEIEKEAKRKKKEEEKEAKRKEKERLELEKEIKELEEEIKKEEEEKKKKEEEKKKKDGDN